METAAVKRVMSVYQGSEGIRKRNEGGSQVDCLASSELAARARQTIVGTAEARADWGY